MKTCGWRLRRLAQSEPMQGFFIQMWILNSVLARQVWSKVRNVLLQLANAYSVIKPQFQTGFAVDIEGDGK